MKDLPQPCWHWLTGGTFDSATGGTFQSDTDGTFHSDIPGTFESDMGGTFKVLQSQKAEQEFEIYRQREMEMLESDFDREIKKLREKN